jgi:hypothetical protein
VNLTINTYLHNSEGQPYQTDPITFLFDPKDMHDMIP